MLINPKTWAAAMRPLTPAAVEAADWLRINNWSQLPACTILSRHGLRPLALACVLVRELRRQRGTQWTDRETFRAEIAIGWTAIADCQSNDQQTDTATDYLVAAYYLGVIGNVPKLNDRMRRALIHWLRSRPEIYRQPAVPISLRLGETKRSILGRKLSASAPDYLDANKQKTAKRDKGDSATKKQTSGKRKKSVTKAAKLSLAAKKRAAWECPQVPRVVAIATRPSSDPEWSSVLDVVDWFGASAAFGRFGELCPRARLALWKNQGGSLEPIAEAISGWGERCDSATLAKWCQPGPVRGLLKMAAAHYVKNWLNAADWLARAGVRRAMPAESAGEVVGFHELPHNMQRVSVRRSTGQISGHSTLCVVLEELREGPTGDYWALSERFKIPGEAVLEVATALLAAVC